MLNGASNPALNRLASEMMERSYTKGQLFFMPGDRADTVFMLKAGRVQQYHLSPEGRKLVTTVLKPGDLFGATTLARDHYHHLFAEALDDCVALALDRQRAKDLVLQDPNTIFLYISRLAQRLSYAEEKLQALVFEPVPVRLARCLMEIADHDIVENYTHQDISELLGTYRETVTVALNQFKDEGLIDIERRRIRILDHLGLSRIASGQDIPQRKLPPRNGLKPMVAHHTVAV